MKLILLVLACFAAGPVFGHEAGFRARFGTDSGSFGTEYFVDLPKYSSDAISRGWTQEDRVDDVLPSLTLYCDSTRIVCVLYDTTGYASGFQIAVPPEAFAYVVHDWSVQGFVQWTPSNGKTYWATQLYFVDETFLATPAERRVANRDANKFLQSNGVWVRGTNREIQHIGNNTEEIYKAGFTEQGCWPAMGLHQYMNMTPELPCNSETLYPFFSMTDNNQLVATGLKIFGKLQEIPWFEPIPAENVPTIVPRAPECLYELCNSPGVVTFHVYYIEKPWDLTC